MSFNFRQKLAAAFALFALSITTLAQNKAFACKTGDKMVNPTPCKVW